ncbi:TPA: S-adenosylhomocysteine hydrolase [Aeromonas sobria]|nr:S-adenosylhomocysteine hydrolase [Aeromonas sobria]
MTVCDKIEIRIKRSKRGVFIRNDFKGLGSYRQVGRALQQMCYRGLLLRIGYGLYAKARRNRISNSLMVSSLGGPDGVLIEVLNRLNIPYELTGFSAAYVEGKTTQIPAYLEVKVKKRFTRRILIGARRFNTL